MKAWMMVLALATATPAAARDLGVPAGKGWKHAETGLILMPQLAGLSRIALTDATQTERDVAAQYDMPDKSMFATIYLFHPAIADVTLWFDRSRTAIETRDLFRNAAPASADPIAFAVGGSGSAASLRQVYATLGGGQYHSTALAVVPIGDWVVSVRMSAKTLTADQLDASLQQVIQAIRWPKPNRHSDGRHRATDHEVRHSSDIPQSQAGKVQRRRHADGTDGQQHCRQGKGE